MSEPGPRFRDGQPFRAIVVAHNDRGDCNLCIGAEGYSRESFVVVPCSPEDRERFPVGTLFCLTPVERERAT